MKKYELIGDVESYDGSKSYGVSLGEYDSLNEANQALKEYRDHPFEEYASCYSHLDIIQPIEY
jgi:hypothetical protein